MEKRTKFKILNLIFATVSVLIIAVVIYLVFFKSSIWPSKNNNPPDTNDIKWEEQISNVEAILKQEFAGGEIEGLRQVGIFKEGDLTGDNIPEVLVYTGGGGAYTDQLTLVMLDGDKPVLARFKQQNGEISPLLFLSGASVRHGEAVEIVPEENVIYSINWSMTDLGEIETCNVSVYQWSENTKLFEYDTVLSDGSKLELCNPLM